MSEKKKYVLYDNLVFLWKKKHYFLIIPIVFALLGLGGSYLVPKEGNYVGTATVFTGDVKLKSLTHPAYLEGFYDDQISGTLDAFVASDSFIRYKIIDNDQARLESDLNKVTEDLFEQLSTSYDQRYKATEDQLSTNEEHLERLNQLLESNDSRLDQVDLPIEEYSSIMISQYETQEKISETMGKIQRMTSDLAFFEKPQVLKQDVVKTQGYQLELAVAGFILGVMVTFLVLLLWKYVLEARRNSL